ncbi:hypothetical protein SAMN06298216_4122 [Spirosomataceae bacterium TFI 002]|nr:hypothetical protein SAMN06298216_4122 [Spirosomataceae bacterium TFI 002]
MLINTVKKEPTNSGKKWSEDDKLKLKSLASKNTPTGLISYKLGRTEAAVYAKAADLDITLKPTNQSPYDRKVSEAKKGKK